jgi:hypothetical protein
MMVLPSMIAEKLFDFAMLLVRIGFCSIVCGLAMTLIAVLWGIFGRD